MNVLLAIATDTYLDTNIEPLPHLAADLKSLAATLQFHGFEAAQQTLLLGPQATKTSIESKLRRLTKSLTAADQLWIYIAGRSCSIDGLGLIAGYDTDLEDLEATSLSIDGVLRQLLAAKCQQMVLLLDTSYGSLPLEDTSNITPYLEPQEVHDLLDGATNIVVLASASGKQESLVSPALGHSIWLHHFIEAISGKATSKSLAKKSKLTVSALQEHWLEQLPRTIAASFSSKKTQVPWFSPLASAKMLLIDLAKIAAADPDEPELSRDQVRSVVLQSKRTLGVKLLSGYKKGFSVPDRVSSSNQTYIISMAKEEVESDLKTVFANLRQTFKFKRADLQMASVGDGTGTITTPYFNYSIQLSLQPDDPSQVVFHRFVDAIRDSEQLFSESFSMVFGNQFDTALIGVPEKLNIEQLIDRIEDLNSPAVRIDYDPEATYCTLHLAGVPGEISIEPDGISIVHHRPEPPQRLLRSFFDLQKLLVESNAAPLLPFRDE